MEPDRAVMTIRFGSRLWQAVRVRQAGARPSSRFFA